MKSTAVVSSWLSAAVLATSLLVTACGGPEELAANEDLGSSEQMLDAPKPLKYWQDKANALINYSPTQDVYQRDLLITSVYAQFFMKNHDVYRYPGLAMCAGWEAGILMKYTGDYLKTGKWITPSGMTAFILPIRGTFAMMSRAEVQEVHDAIVKANLGFYRDAIPFMLAYLHGGSEQIRFLNQRGELKYSDDPAKAAANGLKMKWLEAIEAKDWHNAMYYFAEFEQQYMLQDLIYTPHKVVLTKLSRVSVLCFTHRIPQDCRFLVLDHPGFNLANSVNRWTWITQNIFPAYEKRLTGEALIRQQDWARSLINPFQPDI
ncbi:MAG: hypothetical protein ACT4TC_15895 [Myxococcaceae bacterium]